MQMIHPLTHGLILSQLYRKTPNLGFQYWIHSFLEQEKLCQMFATSELRWEFIE